MKFLKYISSIVLCAIVLSSCGEEFTSVDTTAYLDSEVAAELLESDPEALNAYIYGMFSFMVSFDVTGAAAHDDFSFMSVLHSTDMMGEDIALTAAHWFNYDYQHDNSMFNYRRTLVNWLTFYTMVAKSNEIMDLFVEEPENVEGKAVLAHAYALRAMSYYYLIQLYQHPVKADGTPNLAAKGVPMHYSSYDVLLDETLTAEELEVRKGRNTVELVYAQIEHDFTEAIRLFEGYSRPSKNYLNQAVANGLYARFCLLSQQWEKAEEAAKAAQRGGSLVNGLNDGFYDITCSEWMWGFDHNAETQTTYASFFSHISNLAPGYAGMAYSSRLIDKKLYESIPLSDSRKAWFNGADGDEDNESPGAQYPYASLKFGNDGSWTMDYVYMRVAEMYLIEAEALAHQGDSVAAAAAIKPLMQARIADWNETSMSVDEIYHQRRIELWGEGFSYFDLKRLNKGIDRSYPGNNHLRLFQLVRGPLAGSWIYQIPRQEMNENKALTPEDQNVI